MKKVLKKKLVTDLAIFANVGYIPAKKLVRAVEAFETGDQEEALRLMLAHLCADYIDSKKIY